VRYTRVGDPEFPHTPSQPLASFDCRAAVAGVMRKSSLGSCPLNWGASGSFSKAKKLLSLAAIRAARYGA
jgi:hypothetical protein